MTARARSDQGGIIGAPVLGEWLVLHPPGHPPYAFDLVAIDPASGRYFSGSGWALAAGMLRAEDVHGWSKPVLAPLAGDVVLAHDGERDRRRLLPLVDVPAGFFIRPLLFGKRLGAMAGNHIVLATPSGYVFLAHLRRGSVGVRPGEHVEAGVELGQVGHTGNSLGPHLHIQVMDGPQPSSSRVIPFRVTKYGVLTGDRWTERRDTPLPGRATKIRFTR